MLIDFRLSALGWTSVAHQADCGRLGVLGASTGAFQHISAHLVRPPGQLHPLPRHEHGEAVDDHEGNPAAGTVTIHKHNNWHCVVPEAD